MENSISKRGDLASRLQRIATAIFVAGIAGTVAASRMTRGINSASNGFVPAGSSSEIVVVTNEASKREQAKLAAANFRYTQQLLNELVEQIRNMPVNEGHQRDIAMKRARTISRSLQVFDNISNMPTIRMAEGVVLNMCAAPGEAAVTFLSTGAVYLGGPTNTGALTINLAGNNGVQQFTFASGTLQSSIINAINSFTEQTGVEASQSIENNSRIQMNGVDIGSESLVHVRELDGPSRDNFIFAQAIGGIALDDLKDYGKNALTLQAIQDKP